jgi:predicted RNase H-like HicB family nuclease
MEYIVVLEQGKAGYGAFVPDLPGCIAAGESKNETLALIKEAIEFHIEGLVEDGTAIPGSHCEIERVAVNIA